MLATVLGYAPIIFCYPGGLGGRRAMERIPVFPSVEFPSGRNLTPHGAGTRCIIAAVAEQAACAPCHALLRSSERRKDTNERVSEPGKWKSQIYPHNNKRNKPNPEQTQQLMRQLRLWAELT